MPGITGLTAAQERQRPGRPGKQHQSCPFPYIETVSIPTKRHAALSRELSHTMKAVDRHAIEGITAAGNGNIHHPGLNQG